MVISLHPPRTRHLAVVESHATVPVTCCAQVPEGELVFGMAHIYASFNDTFVHVTDISGK